MLKPTQLRKNLLRLRKVQIRLLMRLKQKRKPQRKIYLLNRKMKIKKLLVSNSKKNKQKPKRKLRKLLKKDLISIH